MKLAISSIALFTLAFVPTTFAAAETSSGRAQTCVVNEGRPSGVFCLFQAGGVRKDRKIFGSERQRPARQPRAKKDQRRKLNPRRIPDKATASPSLRRETVRVCPILHDELGSRAAAAG